MPEPVDNVFQQALTQYPIISKYGVQGKVSPNARDGYLEFWPPGESGPPEYPRPKEFGDNPGVEIYKDTTRPIDVLGDVTSHWLINQDPVVSKYYDDFKASMSPDQRNRLKGQYEHAQQNFGEQRPYEEWESMSGMPGYFRGYPFKQWPDDFNKEAYSPEQMQQLDDMMQYLTGKQ